MLVVLDIQIIRRNKYPLFAVNTIIFSAVSRSEYFKICKITYLTSEFKSANKFALSIGGNN